MATRQDAPGSFGGRSQTLSQRRRRHFKDEPYQHCQQVLRKRPWRLAAGARAPGMPADESPPGSSVIPYDGTRTAAHLPSHLHCRHRRRCRRSAPSGAIATACHGSPRALPMSPTPRSISSSHAGAQCHVDQPARQRVSPTGSRASRTTRCLRVRRLALPRVTMPRRRSGFRRRRGPCRRPVAPPPHHRPPYPEDHVAQAPVTPPAGPITPGPASSGHQWPAYFAFPPAPGAQLFCPRFHVAGGWTAAALGTPQPPVSSTPALPFSSLLGSSKTSFAPAFLHGGCLCVKTVCLYLKNWSAHMMGLQG